MRYIIDDPDYLRDLVGYPSGHLFQNRVRQLCETGSHCFSALHCSNCHHLAVCACVAFDTCGFGIGDHSEVLPETVS
jgi:hypothetical protein